MCIRDSSLGEAELIFNTEEAVDELISSSGLPYGTGCMPYHLIKWVVLDSCGSLSICEQRIDLYDCSILSATMPTLPFTAIIPIGCQLRLYASDFYLGGEDDCTRSCLLYTSMVISRAVSSLSQMVEWTRHLVPSQRWIAYKGGEPAEIRKELPPRYQVNSIPVSNYFKEEYFEGKYLVDVKRIS